MEIIHGTRKQKEIHIEAKTKASKIESGYKKRGVSSKEAERRAWATVKNPTRADGKKVEEVAGKSEANRVRVKAEEKGAGNKRAEKKLCHSAWLMRVPYFQFPVIMTYCGANPKKK